MIFFSKAEWESPGASCETPQYIGRAGSKGRRRAQDSRQKPLSGPGPQSGAPSATCGTQQPPARGTSGRSETARREPPALRNEAAVAEDQPAHGPHTSFSAVERSTDAFSSVSLVVAPLRQNQRSYWEIQQSRSILCIVTMSFFSRSEFLLSGSFDFKPG